MVLCLVPMTAYANWDDLVEPKDEPDNGIFYADNYLYVDVAAGTSTNGHYTPIGIIVNRDGSMYWVIAVNENGRPNQTNNLIIENTDGHTATYANGRTLKQYTLFKKTDIVIHRPNEMGTGYNDSSLDVKLHQTYGFVILEAGNISDITTPGLVHADFDVQGNGWNCQLDISISMGYEVAKYVDLPTDEKYGCPVVYHGEEFSYIVEAQYPTISGKQNQIPLTAVELWDEPPKGIEILACRRLNADGSPMEDFHAPYHTETITTTATGATKRYVVGKDMVVMPGKVRQVEVLAVATGEVEDQIVTNTAHIIKDSFEPRTKTADVYVAPCQFNVVHSSDNSTETVYHKNLNGTGVCAIYEEKKNGTSYDFDIVHADATAQYGGVKSGYLYGGIATGDTFTTPITEECGLNLVPANKETLFLREVKDTYLRPRNLVVVNTVRDPETGEPHYGDYITDTYMLTALDADGVSKAFYTEYGTVVDAKGTPTAANLKTGYASGADGDDTVGSYYVFKNIHVDNSKYLRADSNYTPANVFGAYGFTGDNSYLGIVNHVTAKTDYDGYSFVPYYVTADGVFVTGVVTRTNDAKSIGQQSPSFTDTTAASLAMAYSKIPAAPAAAAKLRSKVMLSSAPANLVASMPKDTRVTVTLVSGTESEEVKVEPGSYVGSFGVPEKAGYVFAGWYADENFTVPADFSDVTEDTTAYAKFVKDSYFQLKTKVAGKKITASMTADSENYKEFGFVYSVNGVESKVVANKLKKSGKTDKLVEADIKDLPKKSTVAVTAYFVTQDGTTVYGNTAKVSVK